MILTHLSMCFLFFFYWRWDGRVTHLMLKKNCNSIIQLFLLSSLYFSHLYLTWLQMFQIWYTVSLVFLFCSHTINLVTASFMMYQIFITLMIQKYLWKYLNFISVNLLSIDFGLNCIFCRSVTSIRGEWWGAHLVQNRIGAKMTWRRERLSRSWR